MKLSTAQQNAVEYLDSPQIILAGAGSGKTLVIVAKARYLIEQKGFAPDSIFIITYSNKTQAELEERMSGFEGTSPEIMTFHSFGMNLITEFGYLPGITGDATKASEHRLWQCLKRAIGELKESDLLDTNQPDRVYRDLQSFISRAKDELVTPDEIIGRAEKELAAIPPGDDDALLLGRARWTKVLEAGKIYKSYERIKLEEGSRDGNGGIDYGDMIVLCHRLLRENKVAAATIRSRCRYILVDEFQDANYAQVEILRLIAGKSTGITVVGDDDQAIYRFRGASFGSFKLFQKLFPGWTIFRLEENYRSQANIVRAAQALIEIDPKARFDSTKKMTPVHGPEVKVIVRKCPDDYAEALSVARDIEGLLKQEKYNKPSAIAVLVRGRRHKDTLVKILEQREIKYYYDKKSSELLTRPAKILMGLYEFTVDNSRIDLLPSIIGYFTAKMRPEIERDINFRLSRSEADPLSTLQDLLSNMAEPVPSGLDSAVALLVHLGEFVSAETPLQLLERIGIEAGLFKAVIADGQPIDREAAMEISEILRNAEKYQTENQHFSHAAFLDFITWQETISSEGGDEAETESPVIIQTVHGSKGLEFPVVFMIGLANRRFPPQKQSSLLDFPPELYKEELPSGDFKIQEERRLFYVGMTRAREILYLYGTEKKGTKISQFITELVKSTVFSQTAVIEMLNSAETEPLVGMGPNHRAFDTTSALIIPGNQGIDMALPTSLFELWRRQAAAAKTPDEYDLLKSEYLLKLDKAIRQLNENIEADVFSPPASPWHYQAEEISYTDIESFKTCPLQFYYRKILRLPSPSGPQLVLGSAIHGVLEEAGRLLRENKGLSLENMVASFEKRWSRVYLSDPDRKERLRQRGHELLESFLLLQSQKTGRPIELERKFAISLRSGATHARLDLVGRIDRVDKTIHGYEVIDYKTGKESSADLKNNLQLPIYSLACRELLGEPAWKVTYMFLGDSKLHDASYDAESLEAVKSEIIDIIDEMNKTDFVATPGRVCSNCPYNKICPAKSD
jgi:DNA helicase II / ATP-dependent DNA helicase PcrA